MPTNTAPQGGLTLQQLQAQGATPITQPLSNGNGGGGLTLQQIQSMGGQPMQGAMSQPEGAQLHDTGSFLGNVANSAGNFLGGIGHAIAHPIDTISGLSHVVAGGIEKAVPGQQASEVNFDALTNFYKQRYGGFDNFVKTLKQDPVGAAADLSAVLGIAGGTAGAIGKLGGADAALGSAAGAGIDFIGGSEGLASTAPTDAAGRALQVGRVLNKASDLTNPINAVAKPIDMAANYAGGKLGGLQDSLTQSTLHMTPKDKVDFAKRMPDILNYIENKLPAGDTAKQLEAVSEDYTNHEAQISQFLKDNTTPATGVSRQGLIDAAEALKSNFRTDRDALAIDRQIDDFKNTLETKHSDVVPLTDLNDLKRSTFDTAFNKAGTKVSNDVEYSLGNVLYDKLKEALAGRTLPDGKPLEAFNKEYGTIIKTRQLLEKASGRNQLGFAGKMAAKAVGGIYGGIHGGFIGSAVGSALGDSIGEKIAGNAAHSYAAKAIGGIGKAGEAIGGKVPKIVKSTIPKIINPKTANIMVRVNRASSK